MIAADAGNGMAGKILPLVYKNLPIKIIPLYFKLDGNFPNHPADPIKHENLAELQKTVKEMSCDFGIAFDGDADRIFFIDENGEIVSSSLISALIIAGVSELGKRFSLVAAILASLPLTSILAIVWLYWDTGDVQKVSDLSWGVLWAVLPSLLFFLIFPLLLKNGFRFVSALSLSCLIMFLGYSIYAMALKKFGITT